MIENLVRQDGDYSKVTYFLLHGENIFRLLLRYIIFSWGI